MKPAIASIFFGSNIELKFVMPVNGRNNNILGSTALHLLLLLLTICFVNVTLLSI